MENPDNHNPAQVLPPQPRRKIAASSTKLLAELIRQAQPDPDRPLDGIDTISAVETVVRAALRRGVTVAQIVEILSKVGIDLRPSTLQTYLRILAQEKSNRSQKKDSPTAEKTKGPASGTA